MNTSDLITPVSDVKSRICLERDLRIGMFRDIGFGYVYFAYLDGYVKIGQSKNPDKRTKSLKAGLFHTLYLPNYKNAEMYFHRLFFKEWVSNELFALNGELVEWINSWHMSGNQVVDSVGDVIYEVQK